MEIDHIVEWQGFKIGDVVEISGQKTNYMGSFIFLGLLSHQKTLEWEKKQPMEKYEDQYHIILWDPEGRGWLISDMPNIRILRSTNDRLILKFRSLV